MSAASPDRPQGAARHPLDQLEGDVAGEAVHDDDVGGIVEHLGPLDVADEVQPGPALAGQLLVHGDELRGPLDGLGAVGHQRHPRARQAEHHLGERRAHVGELHEVLRTAGDVGAHVEQQDGRAARDRHREGEGRAVDAAIAAQVEQAGGERRPGGAAGDERLGAAVGDGLGGLDDRRLRRGAHRVGGIGGLGDRYRSIDDLHPRDLADLLAGPEEDDGDALGGRPRGAGSDFSGA